jgi:hypothetical protein
LSEANSRPQKSRRAVPHAGIIVVVVVTAAITVAITVTVTVAVAITRTDASESQLDVTNTNTVHRSIITGTNSAILATFSCDGCVVQAEELAQELKARRIALPGLQLVKTIHRTALGRQQLANLRPREPNDLLAITG